jgi:hypothetical protein
MYAAGAKGLAPSREMRRMTGSHDPRSASADIAFVVRENPVDAQKGVYPHGI